MTIGQESAIAEFFALADEIGCLWLAHRIMQVSDAGDAHDRLSPLVHLVAASDSLRTLQAWSATDLRLEPWAALSERLWHADQLMRRFPPVMDANRVSEDFRGELTNRYLAAMAASRLPIAEARLRAWLRTIKLWLLMRAVDAAEAGYVFERSIRKACDEIRLACDDDRSPRLAWLETVAGDHEPASRDELENRFVYIAAALNANKDVPLGQRSIAKALARVVDGQWKEDPRVGTQPLWRGEVAPRPTRAHPYATSNDAPPDLTNSVELEEDDEDGDWQASTTVDPEATPAAQAAKARGVLLVNQAEGHMLAWDWHSLILDERFLLLDLIDSLVHPERGQRDRLGGAMMAVALLTSNSARRVVHVQVGRSADLDWRLDVRAGRLHRTAARRDRRWMINQAASAWVQPLAGPWRLELRADIASVLREAMPGRGRKLDDAWRAICPDQTYGHWLNSLLAGTPGLERLSSPSLARAQRHCAFDGSADYVLARLVSSNSRTALPSSCSYGAFNGTTVQAALEPPFARLATLVTDAEFSTRNAAGSEMDVDSIRLRAAIGRLRKRIEAAAANDWTAHHNFLTSLCVIGLLVSTGARPVSSPFQSLAWLNFDARLIYIDDKAVREEAGSRLCILASAVATLIRETYVPHLRQLGRAIAASAPDFAEAIEEVLNGSPAARLPLFFFVRAAPEFDWAQVTEASLSQLVGKEWPLPWNFARHRLATRLRRAGLDAEIIDALLGHGESGSESHGAHSLRILGEDLERARPHIEALTDELAIGTPTLFGASVLAEQKEPPYPLFDGSRPFGAEARWERRKRSHEQAAQAARLEIERALRGRPPEAVSGEEWEAIGRQMLLREDGLPQPFASLRYAAYETFLHRLWHERGVRPRMRRRYTVPSPARSAINELAVRARERVAALRDEFEAIVRRLDGARIEPMLARTLAAVDICLNAQVADAALLDAVVMRPNLVLVHHNEQWYVEAYEGQDWCDGMPVRRFAVTARSAHWMVAGSQRVRRVHKPQPIPEVFANLAAQCGSLNDTIPRLLKQISRLVDQYNILTLSGFDAAVLAGRIKLSALPHGDVVRATEGRALSCALADKPTALPLTEDDLHDGWHHPGQSQERTADACRELMRGIGRVLSDSTERATKAAEIQRLLKNSAFITGDLPATFGRWVVHLLDRGSKTHPGALKLPSVERYFNALASKVAAVGHGAHLIDMDGEELTDLYHDLLQAPRINSVKRVRKHRTTKALPDEKADFEDDAEGDRYAAARLTEFHEFAQELHGLEDPDWSELGEFSDQPSGRPGILTTAEYTACLTSLVGTAAQRETPTHLLECAWVLLLCFRFGLRGGEAVGLQREDWIERAGAVVVLVRTNSARGLKTTHAKRVVPLIEELSNQERSVVEEMKRRCEERPVERRDVPMIADLNAESFKYRRLRITGRLLRLIKLATLNDRATLHHARHSFANRVFTMLTGKAYGLGSEAVVDAGRCESVRRLLLGHLDVDRRALWALCRLMGHSSPVTLVRSYLHPQVTPHGGTMAQALVLPTALTRYRNLDTAIRNDDYLKNLPEAVEQRSDFLPPPTLVMLLNYLRLRRKGNARDVAAYVTGVEPTLAARLEDQLSACALRLERVHRTDPPLRTSVDLIRRISSKRFGALVSAAQSMTAAPPAPVHLDALVNTVGRSRQIVLFEAAHFAAMDAFAVALGLTAEDLVLLQTKSKTEQIRHQIKMHSLDRFAQVKSTKGNQPQVDKAVAHRAGDLSPVEYSNRAAIQFSGKGFFGSSYELIVAWCCYTLPK